MTTPSTSAAQIVDDPPIEVAPANRSSATPVSKVAPKAAELSSDQQRWVMPIIIVT